MDEQQKNYFYDSIYKHLSFLNDVALNAGGDATVKLINQTINQYANSPFVKYCVQVIDSISQNEYDFCKKLFEISCALVKYRRDPPGHEIVFTPLLLIRVREGDCKKFTVWICSVLKCRGIMCANKVVNYEPDYGWQHIYAIAFPKLADGNRGLLILDPVNKEQFNVEVNYRIGRVNFLDGTYGRKKLGPMAKLSIMGNLPGEKNETFFGLGEASDEILGDLEEISGGIRRPTFKKIQELEESYIEGVYDEISGPDDDMSGYDEMGKKSKAERKAARAPKKAARKEKRKKIFKKVKKVGLAPARAAFITLIHAGASLAKHTRLKFNLALKLAQLWQKDKQGLIDMWTKLGGKPDALKNAIVKASKVQLSGPEADLQGIGAAGTAAVAAAVTASAPVLALTLKLLYKNNLMRKQDAAEAADFVEAVEDANTTADGNLKPDVLPALKAASKFIDEGVTTDDGGDRQAQQALKQTPTKNDRETPEPAPGPTFTSQSSAAQSASNPSYADEGGKAQGPTEKGAEETQEETKPTNAGFNLLNPSSLIAGSFQVQFMTMNSPNFAFIGEMTGAIMLGLGLYLTAKSFIKT